MNNYNNYTQKDLETAIALAKEIKEPLYLTQDGEFLDMCDFLHEFRTGEMAINATIYPDGTIDPTRVYLCDGDLLPSVTEVLGSTRCKKETDKLRRWEHKLARIHGKGKAREEREAAAKRGIATHEAIAQFLAGNLDPTSPGLEKPEYFNQALPLLKLIRPDVWEIEQFCYYPEAYAGRLDLICEYDGKLTLFDWTTSQRFKKRQWLQEKFLQGIAYAIAWEENSGHKIEQVAVGVMSPEKLQLFTELDLPTLQKEWENRLESFKNR